MRTEWLVNGSTLERKFYTAQGTASLQKFIDGQKPFILEKGELEIIKSDRYWIKSLKITHKWETFYQCTSLHYSVNVTLKTQLVIEVFSRD